MSTQHPAAAQVARDYFGAWSAKDLDRTVSYAADAIVCDMPAGRFEGTEQFRKVWTDFLAITIGADLIAVYGDDEHAVVVYDVDTVPVKKAAGADYLTVRDGKITSIRMIFDAMPFAAARQG
jgi:ketosteroid isomerase-like protein